MGRTRTMPRLTTPDTPPATRGRNDAFAAMREANYRFYAMNFIASSLGLQMLSTAIG